MKTTKMTRWIVGVLLGMLVLALTAWTAYGTGRSAAASGLGPTAAASSAVPAACDRMHDTPAMRQLHAQMPAQARAQCDAMHEQMGQMMGGSGMMSGSMAAHHARGQVSGR